ncbi:MAG: hypothetical protein GY832_15330 [Chloroflexi bacterium]|nr:hypothetical protein [Chloroflexota bacterium]
MTTASILYEKTFRDDIVPITMCQHGDPLVLNARSEKGRVTADVVFCMDCGSVITCSEDFESRFNVIAALWSEYGWNANIGGRLIDLVWSAVAIDDLSYSENHYRLYLALNGLDPDEREPYRKSS